MKNEWQPQIRDGYGAQKYKALVLDTAAVATEYAALENVSTQYWSPLSLGFVDPVTGMAEYKANMEAAGVERARAHFQKQLDDYIAGLR
jgi:putative aldouronate transport system substrate-binding protein